MATCSPSTLLTAGVAAFGNLSPKQIRLVKVALLRAWVLSINSAADVTPAGLMDRGKVFSQLSQKQRRMVKLQLLCELAEA